MVPAQGASRGWSRGRWRASLQPVAVPGLPLSPLALDLKSRAGSLTCLVRIQPDGSVSQTGPTGPTWRLESQVRASVKAREPGAAG
jgi:hypothetical protein